MLAASLYSIYQDVFHSRQLPALITNATSACMAGDRTRPPTLKLLVVHWNLQVYGVM